MKISLVKLVRCAIYTRVSTEHGLDQEFNLLIGVGSRRRSAS
jgi:site-specific DNA recombinase